MNQFREVSQRFTYGGKTNCFEDDNGQWISSVLTFFRVIDIETKTGYFS